MEFAHNNLYTSLDFPIDSICNLMKMATLDSDYDSASYHSSNETSFDQISIGSSLNSDFSFLSNDNDVSIISTPNTSINKSICQIPPTPLSIPTGTYSYSRKVFVGGLPPDIDEITIRDYFCKFGTLKVDWPHKSESRCLLPPKGYAFLIFKHEFAVELLVSACVSQGDKLFYFVSSLTCKNKQVQIRPWAISDSVFVDEENKPMNPRRTVFVGGVPRPVRATELASVLKSQFGSVSYASIDVDPLLQYPKGSARVTFSTLDSFVTAVNARFVNLTLSDVDKVVEIKPYFLDGQVCDICNGFNSGGKPAMFYCSDNECLRYLCENCWAAEHSACSKQHHFPIVKETAEKKHERWNHWSHND